MIGKTKNRWITATGVIIQSMPSVIYNLIATDWENLTSAQGVNIGISGVLTLICVGITFIAQLPKNIKNKINTIIIGLALLFIGFAANQIGITLIMVGSGAMISMGLNKLKVEVKPDGNGNSKAE